jgi:tetratricopeptide (TPR) repeat protein
MPDWDFFIAHKDADSPDAESLAALLRPHARVFEDSMLAYGADWDDVGRFQRSARITVALVTVSRNPGFFYREEIVTGLRLAQRDPDSHRVVPVILDPLSDIDLPYGLTIKNPIVSDRSQFDVVVRRLLEALADMPPPRQPGPAETADAVIELLSAVDSWLRGNPSEIADVLESLLVELDDVGFRRQAGLHGLHPAVVLAGTREHAGALQQWLRGFDGSASTSLHRFSELLATAVDEGRTHVASVVAPVVASTLRGHADADVLENLNAMLSPARSTSREVVVFEKRRAAEGVAIGGRTSLVARRMTALPPDERRFVGREELLKDLVESDVVWISGRAGIGKSALAVHWAHRIKANYGDVLYVDMRGLDPSARRTSRGVARILLDAMNRPSDARLKDDQALFDNLAAALAEQHCLLILDNARDAEQVSQIVRAGGAPCIVVTSRQRMQAFTETSVDLSPLARAASVKLLAQIAPAADGTALARISELCDDLPLALRLVAARLRQRHVTATEVVQVLDAEHTRLDYLEIGDRAIRSTIMLSYQDLPASSRQVARYLSAAFGAAADAAEMAVGMATDRHTTALSLHRLVDASFAEYSSAVPDAAQFHLAPLIRLVVAERSAAEDDPTAVEDFRKRIAGNLAERLKSANIDGAKTFADLALEVDPSRALAALTTAVNEKWWDIADFLGHELRPLHSVSFDMEALTTITDALVTTYLETDRPDRAVLAATYAAREMKGSDQYRRNALGWSQRAEQLAGANGVVKEGVAAALLSSRIAVDMNDFRAALQSARSAVTFADRAADPILAVHPLLNLGLLLQQQNADADALPQLERATELADRSASMRTRAHAHSILAYTFANLGRLQQAREEYNYAAQICAAEGQFGNAAVNTENAALWHESNEEQLKVRLQAVEYWTRASDKYQLARSLCDLAAVYFALKQNAEAGAAFERAEAALARPDAATNESPHPKLDAEVRIRHAAFRCLLRLDVDAPDCKEVILDGLLAKVRAKLIRKERDTKLFIELLLQPFINRITYQFWLFDEPADAAAATQQLGEPRPADGGQGLE